MKNKDSKSIIYQSGAGINLLRFFVPLSFLFFFLHALPALPAQETDPAAYDFRSRQAEYFGPEADEPEPKTRRRSLSPISARVKPIIRNTGSFGQPWKLLKNTLTNREDTGAFQSA